MKKYMAFIVVFFGAFLANALFGSVILTPNIPQVDFLTAFQNERVWYAQLQPGGVLTTHPDNEFELGGTTLRYYQGNTSVVDKADNPFTISVSSTGFLSVTFNGVGTPSGNQFGITQPFNTIWVGLALNPGYPDELHINSHTINSSTVLPEMAIISLEEINWTAFKFYLDDHLTNIGQMDLTGNVRPDMFFGASNDEDWAYTVFASYDPTIIPEPSTYALFFGGIAIISIIFRNKKK